MAAKNTPKGITPAQAATQLRVMFSPRIVDTWLAEFGYTHNADEMPADALEWAVIERGGRIRHEMSIHAKRLAERQTMGPTRIASRSEVIR